ncbi:MAG: hypothetical protein RL205_611 [Actinomycetota bacterium]|jgi:purine catabolism regulator
MSLTVRDLLAMRDLGLTRCTTAVDLESPVSWVAVSELADPSPWLEGGEFLLTTGMRLGPDAQSCEEYIGHLVEAGISALGFGTGLSHAEVPAGLIAAAEARGITVLEVPEPVPFVAISRAVSQWLSSKEYEESARAFTAQRELIRTALAATTDMSATLHVLAKHVGGFALQVDARGHVLSASPAEAATRSDEFRSEIDRLRPRGLLSSSAISTADEHVALVPLGIRGTASGFLIVGTAGPLRPMDQAVLNLAVSLISWAQSRPLSSASELATLRGFLLAHADTERIGADVWRELGIHSGTVHALSVRLRDGVSASEREALLGRLSSERDSLWIDQGGSAIVGVAGTGAVESLDVLGDPIHAVGISAAFELGEPERFRNARDQAERASRSGTGLVHYERLAGRGFSSLVDASAASAWSAEYLAGISVSGEAPELLSTMKAWLAHHGQVDAAATTLGVHRHTVRHRLRRAEALLDRSLEDPAVRADLWFALHATGDSSFQDG